MDQHQPLPAHTLLNSFCFEPAPVHQRVVIKEDELYPANMEESRSARISSQSVERRLSDLKREVDAIKRILSQASLNRLTAEVERQEIEINAIEEDLHRSI